MSIICNLRDLLLFLSCFNNFLRKNHMKMTRFFSILILSVCLQGSAQGMQFPQSLVSGETVDSFKKIIFNSVQDNPKIAAASLIGLSLLHPQVRKFIQSYIGHTDANPNEE